ncbi:MAG: hypothetical protein QOE45_2589 [Frankiaceae bacterium]|nr:hypothetical protein [Frankiaceae bacterium]
MTLQPTCPPVHRPEALLTVGATVHGLRGAGARVVGPDRFLDVWLYQSPPAALLNPARWTLTPSPGGTRVLVTAAVAEAAPTPHVRLTVTGHPDTARYRLAVLPDGPPGASVPFDPLRTWLPVRLRPECPDLGACVDDEEPPPLPGPSPVHDYTARDWRALRTALVEFLRREDPTADLSVADPTITALELFAHAGDLLHYRLDRVATEAYLESARLRTSVKRHARLVDFAMTEAVSATTFVLLQTDPLAAPVTVAKGAVATDEDGSATAFTTEDARLVRPALGEVAIYDWSEDACCLPAGSTECALVRPRPADALGSAWLQPGDLLAFEVVDPLDAVHHVAWARRAAGTDWPAGTPAVPAFREPLPSRTAQVVRVTRVDDIADPLAPGLPLSRVRWAPADLLQRSYPVGIDGGAGADEVTVARANIVRSHHGRLARGTLPRNGSDLSLVAAARDGLALTPTGEPHLLDVEVTLPSGSVVPAEWVPTLLEATSGALFCTVEFEDREPPLLRFRTGSVGTAPPVGSTVTAAYQVGGGSAGNVAANGLRILERNAAAPGFPPSWERVPGVTARNPVAAAGGADPMPLTTVRRDAPDAFATDLRRAVVAADYAEAATERSYVQQAVAQRSWSGSWPVMTTVVDLVPSAAVSDEERLADLQALLDDRRMLGVEAAVVEGAPVGLYVAIEVCARPGTDRERVRRDVTSAVRALFQPDRLTLGGTVYLSNVLAAVAALPAVDAVELAEARRLPEPAGTRHETITVAPFELPVLDDDPARPERGRLSVDVRGGGR